MISLGSGVKIGEAEFSKLKVDRSVIIGKLRGKHAKA